MELLDRPARDNDDSCEGPRPLGVDGVRYVYRKSTAEHSRLMILEKISDHSLQRVLCVATGLNIKNAAGLILADALSLSQTVAFHEDFARYLIETFGNEWVIELAAVLRWHENAVVQRATRGGCDFEDATAIGIRVR